MIIIDLNNSKTEKFGTFSFENQIWGIPSFILFYFELFWMIFVLDCIDRITPLTELPLGGTWTERVWFNFSRCDVIHVTLLSIYIYKVLCTMLWSNGMSSNIRIVDNRIFRISTNRVESQHFTFELLRLDFVYKLNFWNALRKNRERERSSFIKSEGWRDESTIVVSICNSCASLISMFSSESAKAQKYASVVHLIFLLKNPKLTYCTRSGKLLSRRASQVNELNRQSFYIFIVRTICVNCKSDK